MDQGPKVLLPGLAGEKSAKTGQRGMPGGLFSTCRNGNMVNLDFMNEMFGCNLYGAPIVCTYSTTFMLWHV